MEAVVCRGISIRMVLRPQNHPLGWEKSHFVEVMAFCQAMGIGFSDFAARFEQAIRLRKAK